MPTRERALLYGTGNATRDEAGCIVTLRQRDSDTFLTKHVAGNVSSALPAFLDHFDPRVWQVVCISTRRTILADLRGRSANTGGRNHVNGSPAFNVSARVRPPEPHMLVKIGRGEFA